MYKNNNTAAVKRISQRSSKANRTRNIFAIVAIILTTFMISTIFSVGISFAMNYNTMSVRDAGTAAKIFLSKPTDKQMQQIKDTEGIDDVGIEINVGRITYKDKQGEEARIPMSYYDESEWENHYKPAIDKINGTYPKAADEIMLSAEALRVLGIDHPEEGMKIDLTCRTVNDDPQADGSVKKTFKLSGWFTNFALFSSHGSSRALVSEKFASQEGATLADNGTASISCGRNEQDVYDSLEQNVDLRPAQDIDTTFDTSDVEGTQNAALIVIVMIALFIVLSGYLLIYNIMYISVSRDIRFYGMLKTLGTSPKQIRKIVRSQMYRLSLIGIPIGLALGALTSFGIVPRALSAFQSGPVYNAMPAEVSFNPLIFIGAALFSLLTIIISCRKPAKLASRVSPVEAVKYTGVKEKKKIKDRKSTSGGKLHKLAYHNVFREKKRALLVFASLFMGVITLLTVNGFFGSLSLDNYADKYLPHDFTYQEITGEYLFSEDFVRDIRELDGVEKVETTDFGSCGLEFDRELFKPALQEGYEWTGEGYDSYKDYVDAVEASGEYGTNLYTLDDRYIEKYNKTAKNKIDIDAFKRGDTVIIDGDMDAYKEMIGEEVTMSTENGEKTFSKEVAGIFGDEDANLALNQYTPGAPTAIYVSDSLMGEFAEKRDVVYIDIDVDPEKEAYVKGQLAEMNMEISSENGTYVYEARTTLMEEFSSTMRTMTIMGSGISIILILIGLINFVNVMLTGVYTRRNELAVMESIGMTKKQVKKMLTFEGLYYAIITAIIIMTAGNGILYLLAGAMPSIADYAVFRYPYVLVAVMMICIFVICTAVPRIVYGTISKESVTERLREVD